MDYLKSLIGSTVEAYNEQERADSVKQFEDGLDAGWGPAELHHATQELPKMGKVIFVRHAMGYHNAQGGAGTLLSRDAELNPAGVQQAGSLGKALKSAGVNVGLVVCSPFRRTIQTALGCAAAQDGLNLDASQFIITPLCAEHTWQRTTIGWQGDRGSSIEALEAQFSQYNLDFSPVSAYCQALGIQQHKWWHHSASRGYETAESFATRALAFRQWLGEVIASRNLTDGRSVLVFGHGGIFVEACGLPKYANCEIRCFMFSQSGAFLRLNHAAPVSSRLKGVPSHQRIPDNQEPFVEILSEPMQRGDWKSGDMLSITFIADPGHNVEVVMMRETAFGNREVVVLRDSKQVTETETFTFELHPLICGEGRRFLVVRSVIYPELFARTAAHNAIDMSSEITTE